jgi:tetratricopeptide (TPR) repeat protein
VTRRTTSAWAASALLLLSALASAGEGAATAVPPAALTTSAAADEAARLAAAQDQKGLARLAAALPFDQPWLVTDELCARGAFDAADSLARATPPPRAGGVVAFVEAQRHDPTPRPLRDALASAQAARARGKADESLRIVVAAGAPGLTRRDVASLRLLHERAVDLERLGDPRAAVAALLELVTPVKAMNWPEREALLIEQAAEFALTARDLDASAGLWERAAEIRRGLAAPPAEGNALWRVARIRFDQGRLGDALSTMRLATPLLRHAGEGVFLGRALSALALFEDAAGDLAAAMGHHEDALRLLGPSPNAMERVLAAVNAARTCHRLNDVARALGFLDHALADPAFAGAATAALPDPRLTALRGQVLLNRADFLTASGEVATALTDVEEAGRAFAQAGDRPMEARAAGQRGLLLSNRGDFDGASKAYGEALTMAEPIGDRSLLGLVRSGLGTVAMQRGLVDDAMKSWEAAIDDARASGSQRVEAYCLGRVADALLGKGDARAALVRAKAAVALESRETRGLGADEAATLAAGSGASSEIGLAAAARLGDLAAWFEMADAGRASALAESVGGRAAIQAAAVSDVLTVESESATAALALAFEDATKARSSGDLAASRAAAATESAARERLRVVLDRIERRKKLAAGLDAPTPPTLDEVRAHVGNGRALIVFHVGEKSTDALVATADGARLVDLGDTKAFVDRCHAAGEADAPDDSVAAARAGIVDTLALPKDVRTLLVVPDGPVATVPFALLDPGRDVAIVPSALVWTLLDAARGERGTGVLAIGDPDYAGTRFGPLPATRSEAETVGTRAILGEAATEDAVRRAFVASPRWRAVHFACHGVIDPRHASLSGLALTRAAPDDGTFTAREILGLPVPADLVVLSACEAGRPGAQSAATGLPPAFLAAGAPRVVANLWKVDDEAGRVFSVAFHKAWAKDGVTAATALREARDAVRADPRFAAPRHWAGWVLWGLPD